MSKIILILAMLAGAALLTACGEQGSGANNAANTASAATKAAVEAEIKKTVADMATALGRNDVSVFEKLYAENYMFVGPDGSIVTGAQRNAAMKTGESVYETIAYDDVIVRVNGEGTGAISISRATVKGKHMGKPIDGQFRVTHMWSKTNDGWRLASGQTTAITGPTPSSEE